MAQTVTEVLTAATDSVIAYQRCQWWHIRSRHYDPRRNQRDGTA
jgi:hypothetical protein